MLTSIKHFVFADHEERSGLSASHSGVSLSVSVFFCDPATVSLLGFPD